MPLQIILALLVFYFAPAIHKGGIQAIKR